jgi:hypothetical protein
MMKTKKDPYPDYCAGFLLLLIETYANVIRGHERQQAYPTPREVVTATAELMEDNSHTKTFMDEIVSHPGMRLEFEYIKAQYDDLVDSKKIEKRQRLKASALMSLLKNKLGEPITNMKLKSGKTKECKPHWMGWNILADMTALDSD